MSYRAPEPLRPAHVVDEFECGSVEQTEWLRRFARQSTSMGTTKVLVVTEAGSERVVAYYAWCMAQLTIADPRARCARVPVPTHSPFPCLRASESTSTTRTTGSALVC